MEYFAEIARRVIRLSSITRDGNEELVNYLSILMQNMGLKVNVQQVTHAQDGLSKRQFNILGTLGDPLVDKKIFKGLLLHSHLDTTPPGLPTWWNQGGASALDLRIAEGKLTGLGVCDSKLDFLCKILAVQKLSDRKLKWPIYLVGSCGEKEGMFGCKYLIQSNALNPRWVMVGKPTGLRLCSRHRAHSVFEVELGYQIVERGSRGFNRRVLLTAEGKKTSSAFSSQGIDAINRLLNFLKSATDHGFEIKLTRLLGGDSVSQVADRAETEIFLTSHQLEDFKRFFREMETKSTPEDRLNIELGGVGDSGIRFLPDSLFSCVWDIVKDLGDFCQKTAQDPQTSYLHINSIVQEPTRNRLIFDFRPALGTDRPKAEASLQEVFQKVLQRFPHMIIKLVKRHESPEFASDAESEWLKTAQTVAKNTNLDPQPTEEVFSSEASFYAQRGFNTLVFGPGNAKTGLGSPGESASLVDFEKAIRFYEGLIEKVCT